MTHGDLECLIAPMFSRQKIVTASEMLAIEQDWFASGEMTLADLMDRVGRSVSDWILDDLAETAGNIEVLALVGKGNNGGDAIVAAKYLLLSGVKTTVATVLSRADEDPLLKEFIDAGGTIVDLSGGDAFRTMSNLCDKSDVILDGVFGFSISRAIDEPVSSILKIVKDSGKRVVAIDLPSGADPDTGTFDANGLPADVCLSVGMHKIGAATRFGDECFGDELHALDVGIPARLTDHIRRDVNDIDLARSLLPERSITGHKGNFGRALLFAGSVNYVGAPWLSAQACVRSGVGLVALATPTTIYQALAGTIPEATYIPLDEDTNGIIPRAAYSALEQRIPMMDSVLMGVGIGLSYGTRKLMSRLTSNSKIWKNCTVVLDADALTIVSAFDRWWEVFQGRLVITPHAGEISRLLGISIDEVDADRLAAVETAAQRFDCVAVLKGASTLIASPDGRIRVNMQPNDALARGGTGDVLAGLITGLAAKSDPFDAASLGVYLHSRCGLLAREEFTPYAMTAGALIQYLPRAFLELAS